MIIFSEQSVTIDNVFSKEEVAGCLQHTNIINKCDH
jgi:hypothetical protein